MITKVKLFFNTIQTARENFHDTPRKKKKKFQVAARKQKINQAPTIHISSKILPIYTYAFMQP